MESAKIIDALNNVRTLKYPHDAALVPGNIIVVNGQVLVAINETDANADNVFVYRAKATFPKKAALALAVGAPAYWDNTAGEITDDPAGNTMAGIVVAYAAAAATEVNVHLGENK